MFLKFQRVDKIETKLAFPFIYVGGVTSGSECHHTGRVNSRDVWPLVSFPEKNTAAVQCHTENIGQRTRN